MYKCIPLFALMGKKLQQCWEMLDAKNRKKNRRKTKIKNSNCHNNKRIIRAHYPLACNLPWKIWQITKLRKQIVPHTHTHTTPRDIFVLLARPLPWHGISVLKCRKSKTRTFRVIRNSEMKIAYFLRIARLQSQHSDSTEAIRHVATRSRRQMHKQPMKE